VFRASSRTVSKNANPGHYGTIYIYISYRSPSAPLRADVESICINPNCTHNNAPVTQGGKEICESPYERCIRRIARLAGVFKRVQ
jgi:hypothetical protein